MNSECNAECIFASRAYKLMIVKMISLTFIDYEWHTPQKSNRCHIAKTSWISGNPQFPLLLVKIEMICFSIKLLTR